MRMSERYKTDKPLTFKGRGKRLLKKRAKPKKDLEDYKGVPYKLEPVDPGARRKRKGLGPID